ncbi:TonB-dependent receptor [Sphingomonas panacis]|uniref:TonB-dependent receptor n=1 Tax=Sphingomonas panacis TaxID=1560345 RepID=A0A1B3ZF11_9SPHN|nr:TonB-dependent receptor [Sphingomonas panacis]
MTAARTVILIAALCAGAPALAAGAPTYDLPAGRLADVIPLLGRRAQISISVADATLWQRRVPKVTVGPTLAATFRRMLAGTGTQAVEVASGVWRIKTAPPRAGNGEQVAHSQPVPDAPPADIVVTASKRDLALRDYAGSVSVVSGADLTFGGAGGTDALLSRLATVSSTYLGAGRNKLFIRGIADSSFTGPTQATVGQYIGDARLTYNAPDPDLRLYDVQSVEVLEGPQGTLYGAGSLGGIIRTVPNAPLLNVTGGSMLSGVSATQHGQPSGDLAAAINLPVAGEHAALRLVGYGVSDGGYIDNPLRHRDDINRTSIAGGRATLRVVAGDGWVVDLGGIVQQTWGDDSQYADAGGPRLERASAIPEGFDAFYALGDLVVAKDLGSLRFRSTTALVAQRLDERYDATPPGGVPQVFEQRNHTDLVSHETRLWQPLGDHVGWVLGASVIHNATRLSRTLGAPDSPVPVTGVENRVTELTFYGEASYRLAPWLTLTGGGRLSHTALSGAATDPLPAPSLFATLARSAIVADRDTTRLLPSAALLATPVDRLSLYLRYQEGFRPGGLASDSGFVRRFKGDRVSTVEGGLRYGTPGLDPLDLALTVSHTRWNDIQADFLDASGLPSTDNIGNGRIWSAALSGGWRPLPEWRVDASFAFNDGRVTEPSARYAAFLRFAAASVGGIDRIPNVARVTGRLGVDWQHPLRGDLSLHVAGWGRYIGRSRIGVGPVLGAEQGEYADSALTARIGTPAMGLTLGATNLADAIGNRFALGTPFITGRSQITPLRPRTIRLGFDFSF